MRLTEKDKRVIARAASLLVERMIDNPESLSAAEFQASSMVRALQKTYGDNVIRMALEKVMNQMLETRKLTNKKKVNEMGRLSTIHAGGAERRAADATKIAAAKAKRAAFWTEVDVASTLRVFLDDFASKLYQQVEAFVDEVNEDSKTPLIAYRKPANSHLAKKGFLFQVGFSDTTDGESGSFDTCFGIGYPSVLRKEDDDYCIIELDNEGRISNASEIAQFLSGANGQPVQACYLVGPDNSKEPVRFFFEFENYEPMAKAGVWDDCLDKRSNPDIGDVIGIITGKGKYEIEEVVSTDDLFHCLEQDDVFADWLMTGNWDPHFDTESGEYMDDWMEDEIDESVADFSSKPYVQEKL